MAPRKRKAPRKNAVVIGGSLWGSIKKGLSGVNNALKSTGIIGKVAGATPLGNAARTLGYGRKRRGGGANQVRM